ncbi:MAG: EcsC family protein [Lachnospiraceae bacterium]|nr:EcsC family protein [Lachnospiraceae bacterium]
MNAYHKQIEKELDKWYAKVITPPKPLKKKTTDLQLKARKLIPGKVQDSITAIVRTLIKAVMHGSGYAPKTSEYLGLSLAESDYLILRSFQNYKKVAVSGGVLTGAGGFITGLADLPTLVGVKINFLFKCATLYGFDVNDQNERLFILYIFQLAFSNHEHRLHCFNKLVEWGDEIDESEKIDWETFQLEYRDYLDIAKLLQLIPIIGAPAGAIANNSLMETLCENAMNVYRMRILGKKFPDF